MSISECPTLETRILECFPARHYAMTALLQVVDIVESHDVETAAIECVASPRMKINPDFVEQHCRTNEALLMLVMHELHHVLLGHTRQFPLVTPVDNLVFDAVINATLCHMFPSPQCTGFFTELYADDQFPLCLLRPPEEWEPAQRPRDVPLPTALRGRERHQSASVYRCLYSEHGASYQELYKILHESISETDALDADLLGSHEPGDRDRCDESSIFEEIDVVVSQWPEQPDPVRGRSLSDLQEDARKDLVPPRMSNRSALRNLICRVGDRSMRCASQGSWNWVTESQLVRSPVLRPDRRGLVLRALGRPSLLYDTELDARTLVPDCLGSRVHLYLDVSGSIGDLIGPLFGAVLDCHDVVYPVIHQFSTIVADVTLEQLRDGACRTSYGTSIECVAQHMAMHDISRAVIVTDGHVGTPSPPLEPFMTRARIGVALCDSLSMRSELEPFANCWAQLDM